MAGEVAHLVNTMTPQGLGGIPILTTLPLRKPPMITRFIKPDGQRLVSVEVILNDIAEPDAVIQFYCPDGYAHSLSELGYTSVKVVFLDNRFTEIQFGDHTRYKVVNR